MKIFWVTVQSEDEHEGQWLDNLIVVAPDVEEAGRLATNEIKDRDRMRIEFDLTDVIELNTDTARVVGKLVPDDEW